MNHQRLYKRIKRTQNKADKLEQEIINLQYKMRKAIRWNPNKNYSKDT